MTGSWLAGTGGRAAQEQLARFVYSLPLRHDALLGEQGVRPAFVEAVDALVTECVAAGELRADLPPATLTGHLGPAVRDGDARVGREGGHRAGRARGLDGGSGLARLCGGQRLIRARCVMSANEPLDRPAAGRSERLPAAVTWGLFLAWALHDAEELATMPGWGRPEPGPVSGDTSLGPRPGLGPAGRDRRHVTAAIAMMGGLMLAAAARGAQTGGRSVAYQTALTGFGLHAVSHLGQSVVVRGYCQFGLQPVAGPVQPSADRGGRDRYHPGYLGGAQPLPTRQLK
jgi:hypothetical protein